jgi:hypothetical protein
MEFHSRCSPDNAITPAKSQRETHECLDLYNDHKPHSALEKIDEIRFERPFYIQILQF